MRGKIFGICLIAALFASLLAAIPMASALPQMYLTTTTTTVDAGALFTVEVWLSNVVDMYAWEFKVHHDNVALVYVPAPEEGPMLSGNGMWTTFMAWSYNSQAGILIVGNTRVGNVPGASGSGLLCTLRFRAQVAGAGSATTIDLYDEKKYDSNLNLIPQAEPGDLTVNIEWPLWIWDTELWFDSAKGGKIWTEWQVGQMEWDPFYGAIQTWEPQVIYCRIRNTGAAGINVRAKLSFIWAGMGVVDDISMYGTPYVTLNTFIDPGGSVVVSLQAGVIDPWFLDYLPSYLVLETGVFHIQGELQISLDGGLSFYDWDSFTDPPLPGDGYSKVTPGGDTGKFKVNPSP